MGLQNGGATCYMSAVFQQLFMQPAIRRAPAPPARKRLPAAAAAGGCACPPAGVRARLLPARPSACSARLHRAGAALLEACLAANECCPCARLATVRCPSAALPVHAGS